DPVGSVWSYEYDALGQCVREIDPLGNTTATSYDAVGNPVSTTYANGLVTTRAYDVGDRIVSVRSGDDEVRYAYDALGQLSSATDPLGGRFHVEYSPIGLPTHETDPLGRTTSYAYDALGRLTSVTDASGARTRYVYDAVGNLIERVDALGGSTIYEVDGLGRVVDEIGPTGNTTVYTYDGNGNLGTIHDALGNTWSLARDAEGNVTSSTDPDGRRWQFVYDAAGRVTSAIDPLGGVTHLGYDPAGRLTSRTEPDAFETIRYRYDAMGRLQAMAFAYATETPLETTFEYDAMGQLVGASNEAVRLRFEVDPRGRLVALHDDARGRSLTFTNDALGRRTSMTDPEGTTTRYTYDAAGELTRIDHDGTSIALFYDSVGWRTGVAWETGAELRSVRDALGRITQIASTRGDPVVTETIDFTYDAEGNLTETSFSDGDAIRYQYDALNRLIAERRTGTLSYDHTYDYDGAGNRTESSGAGLASSWSYDAAGRLVSGMTGGETTSYEYDTAGRLVERSGPDGTLWLGYDGFGRLRSVSTEDETVTYGYDPFGNVAWTGGEGFGEQPLMAPALPPTAMALLVQHHDRREPVANADPFVAAPVVTPLEDAVAVYSVPQEVVRKIVHGPGVDDPLLLVQDGEQYAILGDGLGSVRRLLDEDGASVAFYEYDAFGNAMDVVDPIGNPLRFAGRTADPVSGFYDLRARAYDPALGRFIGPDQLVTGRPVNLYAYAGNNPLIYADPMGQEFERKAPFTDRMRHYSPNSRGGYTWPKIEVNIPPSYAGIVIEEQACCWIVPGTGKFKFSAQAGHVRPGDQGTLPQGGNGAGSTVTIPPAAGNDDPAGRINAHEDEHVALWNKAHDAFIGPLEDRVASVTWPRWHKHGKTVEQCIKNLKKCIRWQETINAFIRAGNAANRMLDERDANYMRGQWVNRNGTWVWELHNNNPPGYSQNYQNWDNSMRQAMDAIAALFSFATRDCPPHDPCLPSWWPWPRRGLCPPAPTHSPTPVPPPRPTAPVPTGRPAPPTPAPRGRGPVTPTPKTPLPVPRKTPRAPGETGGGYGRGTPTPAPTPTTPVLSGSTFVVDHPEAMPGTTLTYTLTVLESGGAATTATAEISLPAAVHYVAGSAVASAGAVTYDEALRGLHWTGPVDASGAVTIDLAGTLDLFVPEEAVVVVAAVVTAPGTEESVALEAPTTVIEDPVLECVIRLGDDSRDEYRDGGTYRQMVMTHNTRRVEFFRSELEIYRTSSLASSRQRACARSIHSHLRSSDEAREEQLAEAFWHAFTGTAVPPEE
ncbi:MAG: RHS repeat protein, partial [Candidatus Bipolaricaulota bacterium]